jgi:hypothetical protein
MMKVIVGLWVLGIPIGSWLLVRFCNQHNRPMPSRVTIMASGLFWPIWVVVAFVLGPMK